MKAELGSRPPHVAPFGKVFAIVEGLGVVSAHKTYDEAKTALEELLERRRLRERAQASAATSPAEHGHEPEAGG
jgi:hypothetical protein